MKSDGTPWRPLVHIEDIAARLRRRARGAARRWSTTRRSTSGAPRRTTRSARSPRSSRRSCPAATSRFADGAGPDKRNYRVDCDKAAAHLPELPAAVDGARAASRSSTTPTWPHGLDARRPRPGRASSASRTSRSCIEHGVLDADLRWRDQPTIGGDRRCLSPSPCRSCGSRRAASRSCRSARRRWPTPSSRPSALDEPEAGSRSTSPSARRAPWCRSSRRCRRRSCSSTTTSTSRRSPTSCSRHSRDHAAGLIEQPGPRARQPRRRARQQRRLPAARTSSSTASRCSASIRPRTRPTPPTRPASRRCAEFFGVDLAARLVAEGTARPTSSSPTT